MCDNMYRRIEYASGLGADGINVVIPAGGAIPALRALDIKRGTYLPTNTLAGQFEIMVDTNATGSPKATIAINDFVGKYVLDESRVLTSEEELSVPVLPDWYLIPPEVKIICEHAKETTGTSHAMRNFMMRGPAGTGKTEGAKAIAAALHLPYRFITCSANTEVFDLIGQILPATEENKEEETKEIEGTEEKAIESKKPEEGEVSEKETRSEDVESSENMFQTGYAQWVDDDEEE